MSYESPINMVLSQMRTACEGEVYKAIQNIGVHVDKDELLRALQYDRNQYAKGYNDRDSEIIRCKDCRKNMMCELTLDKPKDWFCADGELKE